jgi:hypothetical protein
MAELHEIRPHFFLKEPWDSHDDPDFFIEYFSNFYCTAMNYEKNDI